MSPEVMVFEDALLEPTISDSAPIKAGVRFYSGAPLKTADGYFIGTICMVDFAPRRFVEHDRNVLEALSRVVMEQMELRLKSIRETELQAELLEKKDKFISVASHELKTPIASLTSSLQLLDLIKRDSKPELLEKLVTQANRSLQKLNRLISDLLDTNRITSGKLNLNKTTINPAELAQDCCRHVRSEGQYEIIVDGDFHIELLADEQKIEQVLVNMVNNAVKYAPGCKKVYIFISRGAVFAKIAVRDDSPGIAAEHLPPIFDRYYRSDNHNNSGLGLGLYICSEIIHHHGGEIGVDSKSGKGSTFWFTLPM